jgi:hypothetical protein
MVPPGLEARRARVGVTGQALHVFERNALFEQVRDGGDAEAVPLVQFADGGARQFAIPYGPGSLNTQILSTSSRATESLRRS